MQKRVTIALCFILSVFSVNLIAQTFCYNFSVVSITPGIGGNVVIKLSVQSSSDFKIGTSSLFFNFNSTDLSSPTFVSSALVGSYSTPTVNNGLPGIASFSFFYSGGTGNGYTISSAAPTEIGRIRFNINTANANTNFSLNTGSNGEVYLDNNMTGLISGSCVTNNVVLPLTLLNFIAKPQIESIALNWQTVDEFNFKGFDVQRSTDGNNFNSIGFTNANGGGNYSTVDNDVVKGEIYYYRLKMVDLDGSFKYSLVQSAELYAENVVKLFPNPTHNNTSLLINSKNGSESEAAIQIINAQGQVFSNLKMALVSGENSLTLPTENLPSGVFVVYVQLKTVQWHFKLTKI